MVSAGIVDVKGLVQKFLYIVWRGDGVPELNTLAGKRDQGVSVILLWTS